MLLHLDETVSVSYSGGVLNAPAILRAFTDRLAALDGSYDLRVPLFSPAIGAALYAAQSAGVPLDVAALRRTS